MSISLMLSQSVLLPSMALPLDLSLMLIELFLIIDNHLGITLDILKVRLQVINLLFLSGVLLLQLLNSLYELLVLEIERCRGCPHKADQSRRVR